MVQYIKYAYIEFSKKPFLVITFCSLLTAAFFGYKWTDSFKSRDLERVITNQEKKTKDSIILVLTALNARNEALLEIKNKK